MAFAEADDKIMFRQWLYEIGFGGPTGWEGSGEGGEVEETGVAVWLVFVLMERILIGDPGAAERRASVYRFNRSLGWSRVAFVEVCKVEPVLVEGGFYMYNLENLGRKYGLVNEKI
jgi:hypothetical protein